VSYFDVFLAVLIISLYFAILLFLKKKGLFERYNLSFYGPLLMWKTEKGKKVIHRLARRERFWELFGIFSIALCFILMVVMFAYLVWQFLWLKAHISKEILQRMPGANMVIAIPVINPILPVGYTILGLAIAVVVHEFSHGILGVVGKIRIKSLGILAFIFPIGAFVEPDEDQLKEMDRKKRMKIFAAGPAMNILVAMFCIVLLSFVLMPSVVPAADGVGVMYIDKNSPAEDIGLKPGSIITEINGSEIHSVYDFMEVMNRTYANQTVHISYVTGREKYSTSVTLADKYVFTEQEEDIGKGFLGIGPTDYFKYDLKILQNPFYRFPLGFLYIYTLPLTGFSTGYNPLVTPYNDFYVTKGIVSLLPHDVFWGLINALYWIFWLNFAVGIFNVLPIFPLDGGYLLQDSIDSILDRLSINTKMKEKIVKAVVSCISIITLLLVFSPLMIKYIAPLLWT